MVNVAFLRAVNVGGHTIRMADLKRHFERLGFTNVETFIASGNVVFSSPLRNRAALERRIEDRLEQAFGYEVKTFVRTDAELAAIAAHAPFDAARTQSAGALCVGFMAEPLPPAALKAVMSLQTPMDDLHVNGREVYWLCQTRQSESAFSNALLEKTLRCRSTFRSMTTVKKLAAKYCDRRQPTRTSARRASDSRSSSRR